MAITTISTASKLATGINVFTLPRERHPALIDILAAINAEIVSHKFPMNVSANFHRAIDAPIVLNYNQYTDRALGQFLRTQPATAALMKRTHDLSEKHEIRWYEVVDVIGSEGKSDLLEISDSPKRPAVVGIVTVKPGKQDDVLALFKTHGEVLRHAQTPGFVGVALHRGYQEEHISTYEQWESIEAYQVAARNAATAELLSAIGPMITAAERHLYEVVSVTRFK
jgi:quinol monooxygenase YgiN